VPAPPSATIDLPRSRHAPPPGGSAPPAAVSSPVADSAGSAPVALPPATAPGATPPAVSSPPGPAPAPRSRIAAVLAVGVAVAAVALAVGVVLGRGLGPATGGEPSAAPGAAPPLASAGGPASSASRGSPAAAHPGAPAGSGSAGAPPIARADELGLNAEVSGTLEASGVRRHPFTVPAGRYFVDLFVKAPDPPEPGCGSQPKVTMTVIDRDEARVGEVFTQGTWDRDNWEKRRGSYDLSGAYQANVRAGDCRVLYRLRVVSSAP
jgi:hypothetical protein